MDSHLKLEQNPVYCMDVFLRICRFVQALISAEPKADITKIVPLLEVMSRLQINDMEVKLNQYMPPSSNKEIEIQ